MLSASFLPVHLFLCQHCTPFSSFSVPFCLYQLTILLRKKPTSSISKFHFFYAHMIKKASFRCFGETVVVYI
ncbi:hypothetical protein Peur_028756 [Populus x canadensis]